MAVRSFKVAAFCAYLAAWLVFAIAAVVGAVPRLRRQATGAMRLSVPVVIGTLLQAAAAFAITRSMASGPLRPRTFEMVGVLILAPLGAALFAWALRSVPGCRCERAGHRRAYRWLRHPIYLAFLAMLVATGFVVSGGIRLVFPNPLSGWL